MFKLENLNVILQPLTEEDHLREELLCGSLRCSHRQLMYLIHIGLVPEPKWKDRNGELVFDTGDFYDLELNVHGYQEDYLASMLSGYVPRLRSSDIRNLAMDGELPEPIGVTPEGDWIFCPRKMDEFIEDWRDKEAA